MCVCVCVFWHTHVLYSNPVHAGTNSHVCVVVINVGMIWDGRVNELFVSLFYSRPCATGLLVTVDIIKKYNTNLRRQETWTHT